MRVLLACALALLATDPQRPVRSATGDALDRYARGDYERAISTLNTVGGFNVAQAQAWIDAEGTAAADRRKLLAATVALEYTAARPNLSPGIIEWACEVLKEHSSPSLEQLWLRASIALVEGRQGWAMLTGPRSTHLAHAQARFPDNPYFRLAEAVGGEVEASEPPPAAKAAGVSVVVDRLAADMLETPADRASHRGGVLQKAASTLEKLLSDESVRAEAHLRLGYVQLRLGRRDLALEHFARIDPATSDVFVKYLGHLYTGWTLAREGRADAAAAAYRSALEAAPGGRSAATLLTSLLVMNDRLAEAEVIGSDFLAASGATDDPWRVYLLGDYRAYPALVDALREAVR